MAKNKILYICQQITPYLPENEESYLCRHLSQAMQERDNEIRTFMPRYGCVNERRNQLHEVIRLSGMNLIINDNDHQLIIKVSSIPAARIQIYFIERFIGIITEHFAGAFPTWIAPIQVKVICVSEKSREYALKVAEKLEEFGIRTAVDVSDERIGYKIRNAQLEKVPYMSILGENEMNANTISIRKRNGEEIKDLKLEDFVETLKAEIASKK